MQRLMVQVCAHRCLALPWLRDDAQRSRWLADPEMKEGRSALWEVSQKRGYPLVFTVTDGKCEFVGDWEQIQELLDTGSFDSIFSAWIK